MDACSNFLNQHHITDISTGILCFLISFILTHSNFVFDDHSYLQASGTAMGTKMAPCFADLFMASIEQTFVGNSLQKPLFYMRLVDNIFMISTHGHEEHQQFTTRADCNHPSMKLTTEISSTSLTVLDVFVCVTATGIKTSLCRKTTTNRSIYLMYCSFHPHHIKPSIVFSQFLRHKCICSDISDYEHEVNILTQLFIQGLSLLINF